MKSMVYKALKRHTAQVSGPLFYPRFLTIASSDQGPGPAKTR